MTKKATSTKPNSSSNPKKGDNKAERVIRSRTRDILIEDWLSKKIKKYVAKLNGHNGNLHELVLLGIEKPLIKIALEEVKANQVQAAKILGINRNTLRKKIKLYNIKVK